MPPLRLLHLWAVPSAGLEPPQAERRLDKRSQPPTESSTSLLRALAKQLSTYGLTQVGCPLQPHPLRMMGSRGGLVSELHLVMNPVSDDHNMVTWVHQLEVGEKSSAPGVESCTRGLSCHRGGEATAASLPLK